MESLQRSLLRLAICTGVTVEPAMHKLQKDNAFNQFARHAWKVSRSFESRWSKCSAPQIYESFPVLASDGSEHHIYMDSIFGRFLVDGLPVSRLPEDIVRSPNYQRVFQNAEFTVQPNLRNGVTIFSTTSKYENRTYQFYQEDGTTIIQELFESVGNHERLELLPNSGLQKDFPFSFSQNFSHWWNEEKNLIVFRPIQFDLPTFQEIKYTWNLGTNCINEIETSRQLISIHHNVFTKLCTDVYKIEPLGHIHAWLTKSKLIEVDLTRLGLKFSLNPKIHRLFSREYPNMLIDPNQNIGTLVGLENKLVLTEEENCDIRPARKVIVPHCSFEIIENDAAGHQRVHLNRTSLRNPRFFPYDLEYHKKLLEAPRNQAAWSYLAAHHGATASPLPDLFTGLTGTEMAFQILRSARVWSCQPYDAECLATFQIISGFSPKRKFYPEHLQCQQRITWPAGLPSTCAHEGYTVLVDKLMEDSVKLAPLFSQMEHSAKIEDKKTNLLLPYKHYWRQNNLDNYLLNIESLIYLRPEPVEYERQSLLDARYSINKNVRELSYMCGKWKSFYGIHNGVRIVRHLLISCAHLTGKTRRLRDIKRQDCVTSLSDLYPLRNCWLDFYRLALSVGENDYFRHWWTVLLTSLAFVGVDVNQLRILHMIAVHRERFQHLRPPEYAIYPNPASTFNIPDVKKILDNNSKAFNEAGYSTEREKNEARSTYNSNLRSEVSNVCNEVERKWIPRQVCQISINSYGISGINMHPAEGEINNLIKNWYENSKLDEFLENFETILASVVEENELKNEPLFSELGKLSNTCDLPHPRPNFDLRTIIQSENLFQIDSSLEEKVFHQIPRAGDTGVDYQARHFSKSEEFVECLKNMQIRSKQVWEKVITLLNGSTFGAHSLILSGLFPRLVPSILLPTLVWNSGNGTWVGNWNLSKVQTFVGAGCVYWTLEQKMARCIRYLRAGSSMELALLREEETVGLKSWSPSQNPEWLLLELELNMTIRPMQVKVLKSSDF